MNQEKFVNQYIEILNATVTEAIQKNLVLQSQKRVTELELEEIKKAIDELVKGQKSKDAEIESLKQQLNASRRETVVAGNEREELRKSIQHVDTFKNELVKTRTEIDNLNAEIQTKEDLIEVLRGTIVEKEQIISGLLEEKNKPKDVGNTWVKKVPAKKKSVKIEAVKDAGKF